MRAARKCCASSATSQQINFCVVWIGRAALGVTDNGWSVAAPGTPAERAGVKREDRITTIDGRSAAEMSLPQITDLTRG
ncbi:PDZ domain-containing protein [Paraburkholderia sediminicola]|uniref:PDZ domain-containing protein n=1 Tax=Paraburkholderia sediminicola TaxID=458836 RepID=UPI0038BC8EC4